VSITDRVRGVKGVVVMGVQPGTGADAAGIEPTTRDKRGRIVLGDIIVGVDGEKIDTNTDLFRALDGKKVGDSVELLLRRDESTRKVRVRLSALKD
jgi:S1-C subfamily serine protease